jgi:hypothetical protein
LIQDSTKKPEPGGIVPFSAQIDLGSVDPFGEPLWSVGRDDGKPTARDHGGMSSQFVAGWSQESGPVVAAPGSAATDASSIGATPIETATEHPGLARPPMERPTTNTEAIGPYPLFASDCDEPTCEGGGTELVENTEGSCPTDNPSMHSDAGVRLGDGALNYSTPDLVSKGFGKPWSHTRSWTNITDFPAQGSNGNGTIQPNMARLIQASHESTNYMLLILGTSNIRFYYADYTTNPATFTPIYYYEQASLTYDSVADELLYLDTKGNKATFFSFNLSLPEAKRGKLKSYTPASSSGITITYDGANRVQTVERTDGTKTERWSYEYFPDGSKNLERVTLKQVVGSTETTVRRVEYEYYTNASGQHGKLDDLKRATISDGTTNLETKYYRYYRIGDLLGTPGALKFVVEPASYARLKAWADGQSLSIDSLTDSQVSPFADRYYEYAFGPTNYGVSKVVLQGAGCSSCGSSGGKGTYTYQYTPAFTSGISVLS